MSYGVGTLGAQAFEWMVRMVMENWFVKAIVACLTIAPVFVLIPILKQRAQVEPLTFAIWYFLGTAIGAAIFSTWNARIGNVLPRPGILLLILAVGLSFGAVANSLLFQAVSLAPNPGLPPVIYAASSLVVFSASAALATTFPEWLKPVSTDWTRLFGILLVLAGLYLLAGGGRDLFSLRRKNRRPMTEFFGHVRARKMDRYLRSRAARI